MKFFIGIAAGLFLILQYQLWFAEGGLRSVWHLNKDVSVHTAENATLKQQNSRLEQDISAMRKNIDAVEAQARSQLGMVKKDEMYYQWVETSEDPPGSSEKNR